MTDIIKCEYDDDPHIPEGEYKARCIKSEVNFSPWGPKARLYFEIVSGENANVNLVRHYNLKSSKTPNPDGEVVWENGPKSAYIRECKRLFGKTDGKYPHSMFNDKNFLIQVTSVKLDSNKKDLGEANYYSKVDYIIKEIDCQENIKDDWI